MRLGVRLCEGPRDRCTIQPQTMFVRRKGWVTINFTASRGRVTFFNKKYKGRVGRFYIHAHRDSSSPAPLLKNECSLRAEPLAFVEYPLPPPRGMGARIFCTLSKSSPDSFLEKKIDICHVKKYPLKEVDKMEFFQ